MALENLRLIETGEDDPRYAELLANSDLQLEKYRGKWHVRCTREPVTFANRTEEKNWIRGQYRVGDFVELDRGWPTYGRITEITETDVRIAGRDGSWRFVHDYVVDRLHSWIPA